METIDTKTGILTINLAELGRNWRRLKSRMNFADCGASIKADAYGLGGDKAIVKLCKMGCKEFFVALIDEGISLRKALQRKSLDANIHILGGPMNTSETLVEYNLIPVLNSLKDIQYWKKKHPQALADVHIDTGMSRLGLSPNDIQLLRTESEKIKGLNICFVMSHLACSEDANAEMNTEQLKSFRDALSIFPNCKASLANSSGIFLGDKYHFDLARPGASLYGVNPTPGKFNPMSGVIRLQGKILQVREINAPQTVGYGATFQAKKKLKLATVGVGYADGYLRSLSNKGVGYINEIPVPLVGRVSMDLITFDVSEISEQLAYPGGLIDLIGPNNPIDDLAISADTIGYEILTSLGSRYDRIYIDDL